MKSETEYRGYSPADKNVRLGEALEHLQIMLSIEMKELRDRRGLTQQELGERLGLKQPAISKLENANVNSDVGSLLRYIFAMDADFVLGILDDKKFIPISEAAENLDVKQKLAVDERTTEVKWAENIIPLDASQTHVAGSDDRSSDAEVDGRELIAG
jgi:transcriptional regulator with XRE-family HTH domain